MSTSKYPRRSDNYGPDNSGRYPLRWEIQRVIQYTKRGEPLRVIQHAKKILNELNERLRDERRREQR